MRIITADETGLVKVVRLESGECLAVSQGEQARANAVRAICFDHTVTASHHEPSGFFARIHVARSAGTVETWDASQSEREGNNGNACALSPHGTPSSCPAAPVALACLPPASASSGEPSRVLTCNGEGEVQILSVAPDGVSNDGARMAAFSIRGPISAAIALGTSGGGGGGSGSALATGGKENDLKTWDLSTGQCTWKAKNVPHDFLDMRQPVWITSLCSLAAPETIGGGGCRQQIVTGTAHRQVRLYDARAQKRPTHSVDADEHGITTMAVAPDGREVVVADTAGLVRVLDLRKMKWGRRFEGPAGSVRGLAFHPTLPVLACVGLDRMARVYDYRSREQKFQVYLKQRLNAVLFDGEGDVRVASAVDAEDASKKRSKAKEGEDWSGSEGWGSGEEYEMDEEDSSEEEEDDDEEHVGRGGSGAVKRATAARATTVNGRKATAGEDDSGEESSEGEDEESDDDDVGGRGGGDGDEGSSGGSEDDGSESEEEAQPPPSKKRHVQNTSGSAKKTNRR
ncbi:unnamed protein product [Hapterophycus canaliculatus]